MELQAGYLAPEAIAARERFYGARLSWLYRADGWLDRLHFGRRGFWWKHGAKSMTGHTRPVYWDTGGEVWGVSLGLNPDGTRVLGRITARLAPATFAQWFAR